MVWIGVNPRLDPLRGDPRFASVLERMGHPFARASRAAEAGSAG